MSERFDPLAGRDEFKTAAMKRHISNIINSYRNATDVLAEPVQNSVDELVRATEDDVPGADSIEVHIDTSSNTIEIRDTGRGFPRDDLREYLAPHRTDKVSLFDEGLVRGHKGVGLTFLAYGFDDFEVETITQDGDHFRLRLEGGLSWAKGEENGDPPKARLDELGDEEDEAELDNRGTRIKIQATPKSQPQDLAKAFHNTDMTAAILERRTAIGVVTRDEDGHPDFDATLYYTDSHGDTDQKQLNTSYRYPHEMLPQGLEDLDLGAYRQNHVEEEELTIDPTHKDRYNIVYEEYSAGEMAEFVGGENGEQLDTKDKIVEYMERHNLEVYAAFSYSVSFRDKIEEYWNISSNRRYHYPGIRIASDGMISADKQKVTLSRKGGFRKRLWLVYHFDDVEPDLGRKEFPQEVYDILNATQENLAFHLTSDAKDFLKPAPQSAGGTEGPEIDLDPSVKAHEREGTTLPVSVVPNKGEIALRSKPREEQDVIAIFNQLIGIDVLDNYEPVYFSGSDQYDSFFQYENPDSNSYLQDILPGQDEVYNQDRRGVAEFKFDGVTLIEDIVNNQKRWEDMQYLVCWEVSDNQRDYGGDTIYFSEVDTPNDRKYSGVTHLANLDSVQIPIYTIALKDLLEKLDEYNQ